MDQHPVVPWLGFLLYGVILGRTALSSGRVQVRLMVGGILAVAIAGRHVPPDASPLRMGRRTEALATTSPIPPCPCIHWRGAVWPLLLLVVVCGSQTGLRGVRGQSVDKSLDAAGGKSGDKVRHV